MSRPARALGHQGRQHHDPADGRGRQDHHRGQPLRGQPARKRHHHGDRERGQRAVADRLLRLRRPRQPRLRHHRSEPPDLLDLKQQDPRLLGPGRLHLRLARSPRGLPRLLGRDQDRLGDLHLRRLGPGHQGARVPPRLWGQDDQAVLPRAHRGPERGDHHDRKRGHQDLRLRRLGPAPSR